VQGWEPAELAMTPATRRRLTDEINSAYFPLLEKKPGVYIEQLDTPFGKLRIIARPDVPPDVIYIGRKGQFSTIINVGEADG